MALFFLALSLALALALVASRNIYDDEYSSLAYVNSSIGHVIQVANSGDVHPPGMYLLTNLAYRVIPSPRWMTLFDVALLYAGLTVFVLNMEPLFPTLRGRICFLVLATLNPQLLMWGVTIRWYGWWVPLALVTIVVSLQPAVAPRPKFSTARAIAVGLLLALLFFINYITLVFGVALAVALLFRYSARPWKQYLISALLFAVLIGRQFIVMRTVHMPGGQGQRSSAVLSFLRLVDAVFCSEAYLPWHPLAILASVCFVGITIAGLCFALRTIRRGEWKSALWGSRAGLASVILLSILFFAMVAASGLGTKPRNGLLLAPALAPAFALVVETFASGILQSALIAVFALWGMVGIEHLVRRQGLEKASMINHPEEVISYVRENSREPSAAPCTVIVTYDPMLTFSATESKIPNLLALTTLQNPIYAHTTTWNSNLCPSADIYWVDSYLGGLGATGLDAFHQMQASEALLHEPAQHRQFSVDPDAARKRKFASLTGASDIPDYRYTVDSQQITAQELQGVLTQLTHFVPADGVTAAPEPRDK